MKTIQQIAILLVAITLTSCGDKEAKGGLEQFQDQKNPEVTITKDYSDSIQLVNSKVGEFRESSLSKREQVNFLTIKRDSIKSALTQIEMSLKKVNEEKIAPGINGVNSKLNELKGQKENLQEQAALQGKELVLAEKKKVLLSEEKVVYDAQKQALYDKGAAPENFILVDSLLLGINAKIKEQMSKIKNLNRSSSDILEQVASIDEQRNSLSSKIRNNYTAKQIFDDFSKEEKARLGSQLTTVESQLSALLSEENEINMQLEKHAKDLSLLNSKQNSSDAEAQKSAEQVAAQNADLEQQILDEVNEKKKGRITLAFIGVGILALVIVVFYFLGKKRKLKRQNLN